MLEAQVGGIHAWRLVRWQLDSVSDSDSDSACRVRLGAVARQGGGHVSTHGVHLESWRTAAEGRRRSSRTDDGPVSGVTSFGLRAERRPAWDLAQRLLRVHDRASCRTAGAQLHRRPDRRGRCSARTRAGAPGDSGCLARGELTDGPRFRIAEEVWQNQLAQKRNRPAPRGGRPPLRDPHRLVAARRSLCESGDEPVDEPIAARCRVPTVAPAASESLFRRAAPRSCRTRIQPRTAVTRTRFARSPSREGR